MKILVLLSILQQVLPTRDAYFETGNKILFLGITDHILHLESYLPRYIEFQFNFQKTFEIAPQVFVSQNHLDWENQLPNGFRERISFVTIKGFRVQVNAVATTKLFGIGIYWFAFDDTRLKIQKLAQGKGKYFSPLIIIFKTHQRVLSPYQVSDIYNLTIFWNQRQQLSTAILGGRNKSKKVVISVRCYLQSQIDYIKFNILLGADQSLWTSPSLAYIVDPNSNHPFVIRPGNVAEVTEYIEFPQEQFNGLTIPIISLITIRGYNCDKQYNQRLYTIVELQSPYIKATLAKWWDTLTTEFYYQVAIYNPNYIIKDQNCAELFSECNYRGDSLIICGIVSDISSYGWSQPIKSISVPTGKTLSLFQLSNFQGTKSSFNQNQQCISSINKLSSKLQPFISFIKILFLNTDMNNSCLTVIFYSQCNYQGTAFTVKQGYHLQSTNQIPFEFKSIILCPNIIVKFRDPKYDGGGINEFSFSQSCFDNYQFPKYRQPS
ncbi:unnamed protein product (macronuclear) [Paramecium tetraurelia]|uniref:H-type lectin domain-containing protein n=1 Tax=Paramecium tetraurelia TaxID=5888 RepID=A0BJV3_PARTE|nr:uncharacterized protein GSPATT00029449001 [Paramecium tetraurelia]CAK58820.1 unnamed protein product [Paramecium tetraurelia]|eukprot:XP_001426218.1 hypothetical protein (macronuclear) [Paramecium tetraurelia strain d4-2]